MACAIAAGSNQYTARIVLAINAAARLRREATIPANRPPVLPERHWEVTDEEEVGRATQVRPQSVIKDLSEFTFQVLCCSDSVSRLVQYQGCKRWKLPGRYPRTDSSGRIENAQFR